MFSIYVSGLLFKPVPVPTNPAAPSQLYTTTKTVVETTKTTTYTYTPLSSPTKHTANATQASISRPQRAASQTPERLTTQSKSAQPHRPRNARADPKERLRPVLSATIAPGLPTTDNRTPQPAGVLPGPSTNSKPPLTPKLSGKHPYSFFLPDSSPPKPLQPTPLSLKTPQPMPLASPSKDVAVFAQRFNRIVQPSDLPGPKVGIDTYHVVLCGQEVGVFYAQYVPLSFLPSVDEY
jgi:hypothetical protein